MVPPVANALEAQVSEGMASMMHPEMRQIRIINHSKSSFDLYWVNSQTQTDILMSAEDGFGPGTASPFYSFIGHKFVVKERPDPQGQCPSAPDGVCRSTSFQVTERNEQAIGITEDYRAIAVVDFTNIRRKIKEQQERNRAVEMLQKFQLQDSSNNNENANPNVTKLLEECRAQIKVCTVESNDKDDYSMKDFDAMMSDYIRCVRGGITGAMVLLHEELALQAKVRTSIAASLENYTCNDSTLRSTPDVNQSVWYNVRTGQEYVVHVKHERPASRIHVVENFIDPQECLAMEQQAAVKKLHRGTVADGKGGAQISNSRKALQAGITVDWSNETSGDPIARLSRRVYDYCNHVLGLGIDEHGQEDLMSIQYEGRGFEEAEPDRYTPHCDGHCNGLPHKFGQRMATMVMYCTVPDDDGGGHTNFRNAGVHIKPQVGNAIFFSYIDPETKIMDSGFTEHSGCPVYRGSKKIVTQWIRYGVDHENPWDSFNTLGVKYSDVDDFEPGGRFSRLVALGANLREQVHDIIGRSPSPSSGSSSSSSSQSP